MEQTKPPIQHDPPQQSSPPARRHRRAGTVAVVVSAVLIAASASALLVARERASPDVTAASFLDAWQAQNLDELERLAGSVDGTVAQAYGQAHDALSVEEVLTALGPVRIDGDRSSAHFSAQLRLQDVGIWRYDGTVAMRRSDGLVGRWTVDWSPAVLHPELEEGQALGLHLSWPARAPILDAHDRSLTIDTTLVAVGIEPRRVDDIDVTLARLAAHVELDAAAVRQAVQAAQPFWFVPVAELTEEHYANVRPQLAPVPGVVFQRNPVRRPPVDGLARHTLGRTGEITAELLDELGGPYRSGDIVGRSGLELALERELAGSPSAIIQALDPNGTPVRTIDRLTGVEPQPLRTTLDIDVQAAAESALDGVDRGAALVAVDAETGQIRAVVSRPLDDGFHRALAGRYPPGSTFKTVTAAAALAAGWAPDRTVPCPAQLTFGRAFRNAGGMALGDVALREAFVQSCNTSFVHVASQLGADPLAKAARDFGFGTDYAIGLPAAGGRFPAPESDAELAAAAIGQGRVEASPLHMATVAAAAASGTWREPSLIVSAEDSPPASRPLDRSAEVLGAWMLEVVGRGTGTAAAVPDADVAGKTGTAEIGPDPDRTHAWFIGFTDGLAFAIVVEEGGFGGQVAAPIAARFVEGLPR